MAQLGKTTAFVIMTNNRFFANYKNKRIQTAWSIVAAQLFFPDPENEALQKTLSILQNKGYKTEVKEIQLKN